MSHLIYKRRRRKGIPLFGEEQLKKINALVDLCFTELGLHDSFYSFLVQLLLGDGDFLWHVTVCDLTLYAPGTLPRRH